MLRKLDNLWEKIANIILVISGLAICSLIFSGAFMRYVLHKDFYGSEELILIAAFWFYFIGSSLATKHNTQIKAEMLGMFIKEPHIVKIANIVKSSISIIVVSFATVWSIQYLIWNINVNMSTSVFRIPMAVSVLPIAISFLLWLVYELRDFVLIIRKDA